MRKNMLHSNGGECPYRTFDELLSVTFPPSMTIVSSSTSTPPSKPSIISSHSIVSTPSRLISMSPVIGLGMFRNELTSSHAALRDGGGGRQPA